MPQQREPKISLALYHLFKWTVVNPSLHVYFRGQIHNAERVPQQGPLVVVSNHASDFDPPILSNCMGRPVAFMAKEELFQVPVLSTLIRWYGAYPVKRGSADRSAIRAALASLDQGWAAGIFCKAPVPLMDELQIRSMGQLSLLVRFKPLSSRFVFGAPIKLFLKVKIYLKALL